jgi:hypothetical protein
LTNTFDGRITQGGGLVVVFPAAGCKQNLLSLHGIDLLSVLHLSPHKKVCQKPISITEK